MIIVPVIGLTLTLGLLARVAFAGADPSSAMTDEQTQSTSDTHFGALLGDQA